MSSTTEMPRRTLALLIAILTIAGFLPSPPDAAEGIRSNSKTVKPAELRRSLSKIEKRLDRAQAALADRKAGRASTLLRQADEELARFLDHSGLATLVETLARTRRAAAEPDLDDAGVALPAIRSGMTPLADYVMLRDAEVAYRAARQAAAEEDVEAYRAALSALESSILAPLLLSRIQTAREAIAAGRAALVRRDLVAGHSETGSAQESIRSLRLAAALSQALFELKIASEFVADGFPAAAHQQLRQGARSLRAAVKVAPAALAPELQLVLMAVEGLLDRLTKPSPEDPERLAAAVRTLEKLRKGQN